MMFQTRRATTMSVNERIFRGNDVDALGHIEELRSAQPHFKRDLKQSGEHYFPVTISIVIRTLDEERHLRESLESISHQTLANTTEIIVVDSGSTDSTLSIAQEYGCHIVHIERADFSFGRALNVGCEVAVGDFLVFISGHCVPQESSWLEELVEPLANGGVAISYGRQIGGEQTKFSEHLLFRKYFPAGSDPSQNAYFCNNANAAVRRDIWKMSGGYDEELTGIEDMHFAKKVVADGNAVKYVGSAVVYHYHYENWKQIARRYEREAIALQAIAPEWQLNFAEAASYATVGIIGDLAAAFRRKCFCRTVFEIIAFRCCQYYGSWRGKRIVRDLNRSEKERYFYPH